MRSSQLRPNFNNGKMKWSPPFPSLTSLIWPKKKKKKHWIPHSIENLYRSNSSYKGITYIPSITQMFELRENQLQYFARVARFLFLGSNLSVYSFPWLWVSLLGRSTHPILCLGYICGGHWRVEDVWKVSHFLGHRRRNQFQYIINMVPIIHSYKHTIIFNEEYLVNNTVYHTKSP